MLLLNIFASICVSVYIVCKNGRLMKRSILLFFSCVLIFFSLTAGKSYYTLASGSWSDENEVWSMDGTNACLCSPSVFLDHDTIIINHAIQISKSITATNNSYVLVTSTGSISGKEVIFDLNNSALLMYNDVYLRSLVLRGSKLTIRSSKLVLRTEFSTTGTTDLMNAKLIVRKGTMLLDNSSENLLRDNSALEIEEGNFRNDAQLFIAATSELFLANGDLENGVNGNIVGSGAIRLVHGKSMNSGAMDKTLLLCDQLSTPVLLEDPICSKAVQIHKAFGVDLKFTRYYVEESGNKNVIVWQIENAKDCKEFILERSINGEDWEEFDRLQHLDAIPLELTYKSFDFDISSCINFYRIRALSKENKIMADRVIMNKNSKVTEVNFYPNPTDGFLSIELNCPHDFTEIRIVNEIGLPLQRIDIDGFAGTKHIIELPPQQGIYFVEVFGPLEKRVYRIVRI